MNTNTNRDYLTYASRHLELLSTIVQQMDRVNQNVYDMYGMYGNNNNNNLSNTRLNEMRRPYASQHSRRPTNSVSAGTTGNHNLVSNILNSIFWDPVHIRATETEITNATREISMTELPENSTVCPITMETFTESSQIIQINHCEHVFSRDALMRWFQNHVTCPVCRYDIRGDTTSTTTSAPAPAPVQNGSIVSNNSGMTYTMDFTFTPESLRNGNQTTWPFSAIFPLNPTAGVNGTNEEVSTNNANATANANNNNI